MINCYIVCGVGEKKYQELHEYENDILYAARHDFNEFNSKYWEPKVKNVEMGFAHDSSLNIIYLFLVRKGRRLTISVEETWMSETEKQLAWNLRYQIKKRIGLKVMGRQPTR